MKSEASALKETTKKTKKSFKKRCRVCPEISFTNEDEYLLHINEQHDGKPISCHMCSDCGRQFKTKSELNHHINSKCGTIKQYKCKVCEQELMTAGSLHNHMLRHTGIRKFMCRFCAKLFLTAGQLKVHERIHTYEKAFVCEVCGKGFCHRQSLITHSTLHTGIKPFQCENCGNSFSCIGNLIKHRRTHADTCGLIPLTTHRVEHPATKLKVRINTPANVRLKNIKKDEKKIKERTDVKTDDRESEKKENSNLEETPVILMQNELIMRNTEWSEKAALNCTDKNFVNGKDTDHNNTDILLDECGNKENKTDDIKNWEQTNSTTNNFKEKESHLCKFCQKPYTTLKSLKKHEQGHEADKPLLPTEQPSKQKKLFKCCFCKNVFDTKNECSTHLHAEHTSLLTCFECDKIFASVDSLRAHHKTVHKGHRRKLYSYVCEKCGKQFRHRAVLKQHAESNCGAGPQFQCQICQKYFSTIQSRRLHMKVHDPEKKLQCKYCGKNFRWKGQLKIHERSHTGEKPFSCLYCPKTFAYRESLLTHSTLHTGIKPYLCEACGSRFSCIGNLLKHRVAHAGTCGAWYEKQKSS